MQRVQEMRTFGLRLAFSGIVSVLSLTAGQMTAAQGSALCDAKAVPAQVSEALKSKFADCRPKQLSDMEADDQQLWLEGPNGKACPGITIGHFESAKELLEEGQAFEAGVVSGVENAGNADETEVTTHEVPQDDVPGEYNDKDRP